MQTPTIFHLNTVTLLCTMSFLILSQNIKLLFSHFLQFQMDTHDSERASLSTLGSENLTIITHSVKDQNEHDVSSSVADCFKSV
jgi:hypothetical protein